MVLLGFFQRTWDIVNEKVDIETNLKNEAVNKNIDPYVQELIAATNSNFYVNLIKKLKRYPIPNFPKIPAAGRLNLPIVSKNRIRISQTIAFGQSITFFIGFNKIY